MYLKKEGKAKLVNKIFDSGSLEFEHPLSELKRVACSVHNQGAWTLGNTYEVIESRQVTEGPSHSVYLLTRFLGVS